MTSIADPGWLCTVRKLFLKSQEKLLWAFKLLQIAMKVPDMMMSEISAKTV